jgi:CheY-like chemotaxis protein
MSIQTGQPAVVLLAEDDPGDVMMITDAFAQSAASVQLHLVSDGQQAIDYVRRNGPAAPRPALILLDLNIRRRNGFEVLADLKADASLLSIPIVVLTTSGAEEDVERCYPLHASADGSRQRQREGREFEHAHSRSRSASERNIADPATPVLANRGPRRCRVRVPIASVRARASRLRPRLSGLSTGPRPVIVSSAARSLVGPC